MTAEPGRAMRVLAAVACSSVLVAAPVFAASDNPRDPNQGNRSVTASLNGGKAIAAVSDDPNSGLGTALGTGSSTRNNTNADKPGTRPTDGGGGVDPFAQLVASMAEQACNANRDTIIWEMPVGATKGFTCVASPASPPGSGGGPSLADFALAAEASVPWPKIAINANPSDPATVAVPTYYWVGGYDGSPRSVGISATVQEGERCTPTFETGADGTETQTGHSCVPNMVTYRVVVTARPASYTWDFGDNNPASTSEGQRSVVTKSGLEGLGTPFQAPNWSSPIMHLFNVSSFQHEAEGGFRITLSITYRVDWEASAPATGEHQSGSLGSIQQTVARGQHVREIQVLRGASVVRCQAEGRC